MKKIGIIIFAVALIVGVVVSNIFPFGRIGKRPFNISLDFGRVKGSGKIVSERRPVTSFQGVDVGGVFKVDIVAGKEFGVEVEGDDNLLPLVRTESDGTTLRIEMTKRVSTSNSVKVRVTAPRIVSLETSGASNVSLVGVSNDDLAVNASGISKIKLIGETAKLTADASGASQVNAEELKSEYAAVNASGASHMDVNVAGELRADASGAGKIKYIGTPKLIANKSGAGGVSSK